MNNLFNPKTIVIGSLDGNYAIETEKVLDPYKSGPSVITTVKKRKILKPGERLVREFNKLSKKSNTNPNDNEKRESYKNQNKVNKSNQIQIEDCEHTSLGGHPINKGSVLCDAIENISRSLSFTKV